MPSFILTGDDPNDPTPSMKREIRFAQGSSGGVTAARSAVIFCNKLSSIGTGSVDGMGSALNTPWPIYGGESEVITRAGYKSEALRLWRAFRRINKVTLVYLCIVPPGTGTGTVTFTWVGVSSKQTSFVIELLGEKVYVPVLSAAAIATMASDGAAAINAQLGWPITASPALGVITVSTASAGTRLDWLLSRMRISWLDNNTSTITKSAVTAGSADDDFTIAIAALPLFNIYYHILPKQTTSSTTSTDNGIGEHITALADMISANGNKQAVQVYGTVGTVSQAGTVAQSVNVNYSYQNWQENSDWTPGELACELGSVMAFVELSNRAPNLAGYGLKGRGDKLFAPDAFDKNDRPTATEIKTALNTGVTPTAFTSDGVPYYPWYVTGRSTTNSVADYRARPGHVTSVMYTVWEIYSAECRAMQQDNIASTPKQGEKRLPNFNYLSDYIAKGKQVVDLCIDGTGGTVCILDPDSRQLMKDSFVGELLASGVLIDSDWRAVRHNLQQRFRLNETSPSF